MSSETLLRQISFASFVALAGASAGCSFSPPNPWLGPAEQVHAAINASPILPITESSLETVQETPGKMKLMYGHSCAEADRAAGTTYIGFRVQERVAMPAGYSGTVFLNGFRGDYKDGDRNHLGIGASIVNVQANIDKGELRWEAGGALGDNSGDDAYKWCYWYGLVLWNTAAPELDVAAFQIDGNPNFTTFVHEGDNDPGNDGAVRDLPGKWVGDGKVVPKAVLPRGFGLIYTQDDFNLQQEGFDLGLPHPSGTQIEWTAQTVLKDNKDRRDYRGSMLVSYLMGQSVQVWQPEKVLKRDATIPNSPFEQVPGNDFHLVARSEADWCGADGSSYRKWDYIVEQVPFEYALPVLNGWDNGNFCSDSNVQSTGVWLTAIEYDKQPGSPGKLRYTVASKFDDDGGYWGSDGNLSGHSVVILGFNELTGSKGSMPKPKVVAPLPTTAHL